MHSASSLARSSEVGEARDVCPLQKSSGGKVEQRERERGREREQSAAGSRSSSEGKRKREEKW